MPGWVGILRMAGRALLLPQDTRVHGHGVSSKDVSHACSRGWGSGAGTQAPVYSWVIPALQLLILPQAGLMVAGAAATHTRNPEPWQSLAAGSGMVRIVLEGLVRG